MDFDFNLAKKNTIILLRKSEKNNNNNSERYFWIKDINKNEHYKTAHSRKCS